MRLMIQVAVIVILTCLAVARYVVRSRSKTARRFEPSQRERLGIVILLVAVILLDVFQLVESARVGMAASVGPLRALFMAGLFCVLLSFTTYIGIFVAYRQLWVGRSKSDVVAHLLSHVPNDDSPAWPHILAGVTGSFGVCLLAGIYISVLSTSDPIDQESVALTAGGLIFAAVLSAVSFWTLWQTKRIEQAHGAQLSGFRDLISALTEDLRRLNDDFQNSGHRARSHHQFYLVTTNPYFGNVSYPNEDITEAFAKEIRRAATNVGARPETDPQRGFRMDLLCGTQNSIREFHQTFYSTTASDLASNANEDLVIEKTKDTEVLIEDLNRRAKRGVVSRVEAVPPTQFAIVGNSVYEFILETPGFESEIHKARRISETVACDRFRQTFDLLKQLRSARGEVVSGGE